MLFGISIASLLAAGEGSDLRVGAAFFAAFVAYASWLARVLFDHRQARRRATIDLLLSMRSNDILETHKRTLQDRIRQGPLLPCEAARLHGIMVKDPDVIATDVEREVAQALAYVLNLFEFICASVEYGTYDDELLFATLGPQVVSVADKYSAYIARSKTVNPLHYLYLTTLASRWQHHPPRIRFQPDDPVAWYFRRADRNARGGRRSR
ncbi:DUF4760 domain-containing protein [Acuticoccus sp.]|uniref:DUF4760 domain-containing protein n=1 Tax=Acuticoccus sp. TaxID=1904378 RepID=UPI003B522E48